MGRRPSTRLCLLDATCRARALWRVSARASGSRCRRGGKSFLTSALGSPTMSTARPSKSRGSDRLLAAHQWYAVCCWLFGVSGLLLAVWCGQVVVGCLVWAGCCWLFGVSGLFLAVWCGRVVVGCLVWAGCCWLFGVGRLLLAVWCGQVVVDCLYGRVASSRVASSPVWNFSAMCSVLDVCLLSTTTLCHSKSWQSRHPPSSLRKCSLARVVTCDHCWRTGRQAAPPLTRSRWRLDSE